jgi:hypothetical protein
MTVLRRRSYGLETDMYIDLDGKAFSVWDSYGERTREFFSALCGNNPRTSGTPNG